jgi:uncharacterized protein (TIGR00290 family)
MYHVPATELATLAAESIGIPLIEVDPEDFEADLATDSGSQGDAELEPMERALETLRDESDWILAGVTAGAIESEYQTSRIEGMCDRLACELFAPLWQREPLALGEELLAAGFEIVVLQVAADGLDASWLGRTIDEDALADLAALQESHGVHPLGEGGEFETLVVDGPHMDRRIDLAFDREWEGTRGRIHITDATLA